MALTTKAAIALLLAVPASARADLLTWKTGGFEVKPAGYFQGDLRAYPGWDAAPGQRDDGADVRRLRAGLELKGGRLSGELVVDAGDLVNRGLGDSEVHPAFAWRDHLKNAYLELALAKHHSIRAGSFKMPVSREFLTSAAKTDFIERTRLADDLGPDRDWGVMIGGKLALAHGFTYAAGVFAGDGWSRKSRAETTGAARVQLEPIKDLQIAVNGSLGTVEANPEIGSREPQAKGLHGESVADWTFYHRSFVDGQRRRLGGDVRCQRGPWTFSGEILQARDERKGQGAHFEDLPAVTGLGWSVGAERRLHGPRSKKDKAHHGAPIDAALRYESLRFDDEGPGLDFESLASRAANLHPQSLHALSAGLSGEPRAFLRVMGNAILERYGYELSAPEPNRRGTYVTLLARLQIHIP
jgi:hypothetical protein